MMMKLLQRSCSWSLRAYSTAPLSQPALVLKEIATLPLFPSGSQTTPDQPLPTTLPVLEEEEEPPKPPPHPDDVLLKYRVKDNIVMLRSPLTLPLQPLPEQRLSDKPYGMWYSPCTLTASGTPSTSWMKFVRGDMPCFELSHPVHARLTLDKSDMLMIATPEELLAFGDKYGVRESGENLLRNRCVGPVRIDWKRVACTYKGVEISPYQQVLRFQRWFYPWDAAAGVFWDPSVLLGHEHIQDANPPWVAIEYKIKWGD